LARRFDSDQSDRRSAALNAFSEKIALLIEAAQLEVINEDLPNVIFDAVSEQAEWNNFKVLPAKKDAKFKGKTSPTPGGAQRSGEAITTAMGLLTITSRLFRKTTA
jgi:hypothetical protein